jgi:AcrR family transcriptional regulator
MGKGDETRSMILRQGVETAYRVGLSGLTIGGLADTIGMSKSGLYAHFRSKEALQLAVLEQARDDFIETVMRPALRAPRGEPRARALFEEWLRCGLTKRPGGCLFHKAAVELEAQYGPVRDQLIRDHRDLYDSIGLIAATAVTEGHFRDDLDVAQFAFELDAIMQALYSFHIFLSDPGAERRARDAFDALVGRVRATPAHDDVTVIA